MNVRLSPVSGTIEEDESVSGVVNNRLRDVARNIHLRICCLAAVVLFLSVTTACDGTGTVNSTPGSLHVELGNQIIEDATAAGASDEQIRILERASARGEVTWDDLAEALQAFGTCLDTNGLWLSEIKQTEYQGSLWAEYSWGAPLSPPGDITHEQLLAIGDGCLIKHAEFVEQYYYYQPSVQEAYDTWFATTVREPLIICLRENGVEVDDDATQNELIEASEWLYRETAGFNDGSTQTLPGAVDCLVEAGY